MNIETIVTACLENAAHFEQAARACPSEARRNLRLAMRWRKLASYWREFADLGGSALV